MKPIPFPFPLNIGTDIVHLARIQKLMSHQNARKLPFLLRRILIPKEIDTFNTKFRAKVETADLYSPAAARWLAGRFAAKEALRKAVGTSIVSWKDTYVCTAEDGKPHMVFYSRHPGSPGQIAKLSISHDGDYVTATVLAPDAIVPAAADSTATTS